MVPMLLRSTVAADKYLRCFIIDFLNGMRVHLHRNLERGTSSHPQEAQRTFFFLALVKRVKMTDNDFDIF